MTNIVFVDSFLEQQKINRRHKSNYSSYFKQLIIIRKAIIRVCFGLCNSCWLHNVN